jgi:hypothetical protein
MNTPTDPRIARTPGGPLSGGPDGAAAKPQGALEKFKNLPIGAQLAIGAGALVALMLVFGGNGGGNTNNSNANQPNMGNTNPATQISGTSFSGLEGDRPAIMQNVFEQYRSELAEIRQKNEEQFAARDQALQGMQQQNQQLQQQMLQQMMDFTAEMKAMQADRVKDAERLSELAQQQQQMELSGPVNGVTNGGPVPVRRRPITQNSLGAPPMGPGGQGLLAPLGSNLRAAINATEPQAGEAQKLPFMPPLGFVRATLINGVDAPTGGQGSPALARISGVYKTAMNTTVTLDGCIALLEFNADISTERAIGKPARMTCIYPDGGAATYQLQGYAVDADDGVIGVPGMLYEGDPTRIASSIVADFLAGVGSIIADNQNTSTVSSDGTQRRVLTGDQAKAEIAGGADKAFSSIRDYLKERVDRTQPFIRLDATREINLVILSGQELRAQGSPWTLLFDAQAADQAQQSQMNNGLAPTPAAPSAQPQQSQ